MNHTLYLERQMARDTPGIPGVFYFCDDNGQKSEICHSVERPWVNNERSVSCVPEGEYELKRRTNGRYYKIYSDRWAHICVFELQDVPNRSAILIHAGRNTSDSRGCLLTAEKTIIKKGKLSTAGTSRTAYCKLYEATIAKDLHRIVIHS